VAQEEEEKEEEKEATAALRASRTVATLNGDTDDVATGVSTRRSDLVIGPFLTT
jgi:hypothetical protein